VGIGEENYDAEVPASDLKPTLIELRQINSSKVNEKISI
jgi:hypothetical protein